MWTVNMNSNHISQRENMEVKIEKVGKIIYDENIFFEKLLKNHPNYCLDTCYYQLIHHLND